MWRKVLACSLAMAGGVTAFSPAAPNALTRSSATGTLLSSAMPFCITRMLHASRGEHTHTTFVIRLAGFEWNLSVCVHHEGMGFVRTCMLRRLHPHDRTGQFAGRKPAMAGKLRPARAAAAGVSAMDMKKIIVLGGDGFCGWPTTLHLADQGHDVVCVDNLSRRNIDTEMGCDSLTPIQVSTC